MKTIEEILALNVRRLRKNLGWSQTELADRAGISLQTVNRLEKMTQATRASNLAEIAKALGTTKEDLMKDPQSSPVVAPDPPPTVGHLLEAMSSLQTDYNRLEALITGIPRDIIEALPSADQSQLFLIRSALDLEGYQRSEESDEDAG